MKKITDEELKNLKLSQKGNLSPFFAEVQNMQINDNLLLSATEWLQKTPPSRTVRRIAKKLDRQYTVAKLKDKSGWVIKRLQ